MNMHEPTPTRTGQATRILGAIRDGDAQAADALLPVVYEELRELARARLASEPPGQTIQATALVHEAYLRLLGAAEAADPCWDSRGHFFGAAALAMRRIMVERARRYGRLKHGGAQRRIELNEAAVEAAQAPVDLVELDAALSRLESHDQRKSQVVMLRYFAGLTIEQSAQALDVSVGTVKNEWNYARAWLHRELSDQAAEDGAGPAAENGAGPVT